MAKLYFEREQFSDALTVAKQALAIARDLADRAGEAEALLYVGAAQD
jgi:hypothetical protein